MTQQASTKPVFPPQVAPYIDVAAYLLDARAPAATLWLDAQLSGRELLLLTRADQAEAQATRRWRSFFVEAGYPCIAVSGATGKGLEEVKDYLAKRLKQKTALGTSRGIANPTLRLAALGVPNVGKSTFLNTLIGGRRFRTGDKPGVTRGPQWVRLFEDVEVLDTPGILRDVGALRRRKLYWLLLNLLTFDPGDHELLEQAIALLHSALSAAAWKRLASAYHIGADALTAAQADPHDLLEAVAAARSYKLASSDALQRASLRLIRDFQTSRFGPLTLEQAGEATVSSPLFKAKAGGE